MKLATKIIMGICIVIWAAFVAIGMAKAETDCFSGNVGVSTIASYEQADNYDCIDGTLTVFGSYQISDLIFHNLREVKGSIIVVGRRTPAPWQLAFLKLETVTGIVDIGSNPKLINIQLGSELSAIGGFEFYNNDALKTLRLGALELVESDLRVYENASLKKIVANDLKNVKDEMEITDNPKLYECVIWDWAETIIVEDYLIEGNKVCQ